MQELRRYEVGNGSPCAVITAALHGDEQTASYTAELVMKKLEKEKVTGKVIIYPCCNVSAAKARQRRAPEDMEDLNRVFPGNSRGSYSQKLARRIWDETAEADYILDLHCCGVYGSAYTMCWYTRHAFAKELAMAIGVPAVVHTKGTRGQFYIESCERRGQKGMLIELPGGQPGGIIDEQSAIETAELVIGYLKYIGAVQGKSKLHDNVELCACFDSELRAEKDGLCRPVVEPGARVRKGDVVAWLDNQAITSPFDAVAAFVPPLRYVFAGEELARLVERRELPFGAVSCEEV